MNRPSWIDRRVRADSKRACAEQSEQPAHWRGHVQMADDGSVSNTESRQARLLKRYWIAAGSSFLVLLFMFALYWDGYLKETGFYYTASEILFCAVLTPRQNLVLYASEARLKFARCR